MRLIAWTWVAVLGCSEGHRAQPEVEEGCPATVLSEQSLDLVFVGLGITDSPHIQSAIVAHSLPEQLAIASQFGRLVPPDGAECLLIISSGQPLAPESGPWRSDHIALPGEREGAQLVLELPSNRPEARGLSVDLLFIAADWPEAVCFQDAHMSRVGVAISADEREESYYLIGWAGPRDLSTSNELLLPNDEGGDALEGTPFGQQAVSSCGALADLSCEVPPEVCGSEVVPPIGGRTGWLRAQGPLPSGSVELYFSIDEGVLPADTVILLANLRFLQDAPEAALFEL